MKQIDGQISITEYISTRDGRFPSCDSCVCRSCLYWCSGRCPYGGCYDDLRAKDNPYDKAHPDEPPRTAWTNWNKPGEQAHWCRGGRLYPEHYCERFEKYTGCEIVECVDCNIAVYQDGYISCSIKDTMGCETCIDRKQMEERIKLYGCQWMTETGCDAHINALSLMAKAILEEGEDIEMCKEQCCIGCTKSCGYRCGQALDWNDRMSDRRNRMTKGHNCQLCKKEWLGRCFGKYYGKDVSVDNTPVCDEYVFGGSEERLREIEEMEKQE